MQSCEAQSQWIQLKNTPKYNVCGQLQDMGQKKKEPEGLYLLVISEVIHVECH